MNMSTGTSASSEPTLPAVLSRRSRYVFKAALKVGQRFMQAVYAMRGRNLTDSKEDKKERIKIYKANDLTAQQWSQSYLKYQKTNGSSLTASNKRKAESQVPTTETTTTTTAPVRKTKQVKHLIKQEKKQAHKAATLLMKEEKIKAHTAVKQLKESGKYKHIPTAQALNKHLKSGKAHGASPARPGAASKIPRKAEGDLSNEIKHFSERGYHMSQRAVILKMKNMVKGTSLEKFYWHKIKGNVRCRRWFYKFKNDNEWRLSFGTILPAEKARGEWTTAKNIAHHYDLLEEWLEVAKVGAWFDAKGKQLDIETKDHTNCTFKIIDPFRLISFDETRCKGSMTDEFAKGLAETGKKKTTNVSNANFNATGVACNTADGYHLPPYFIWACGKSDNLIDYMANGPTSTLLNQETDTFFEAMHSVNKKGSMNNKTIIPYLESCILPHYPNLTKEKPLVLICDGHGSHLTWELIQWATEHHIMILLRPPHTTAVTQGEDVWGFGLFKTAYVSAKEALFTERSMAFDEATINGQSTKHLSKDLHWSDLMNLVREPWQNAFSRTNVLTAWKKIGIYPWTRCVEHTLRAKEEKIQKSIETRNELKNRLRLNLAGGATSTSSSTSSSSSSSSSGTNAPNRLSDESIENSSSDDDSGDDNDEDHDDSDEEDSDEEEEDDENESTRKEKKK